jgi:hypothetical protein
VSEQEQGSAVDMAELRKAWASVAEQLKPVIARVMEAARPLVEFAQSPEGQALIAARPPEPLESCHCLCGIQHPGETLCEGVELEGEVVKVHFRSRTVGPCDVPMCRPCADATARKRVHA